MKKKMYKKPEVQATKMESATKVCLTSTLGSEIDDVVSQAPRRKV